MTDMLLIQFIGGLAYATLSLSYFKKKKRDILFIEIIAYLLFSIHYYLLNGITGAICNLIGLIALVTLYLFDKYKLHNKLLVSIFFIIVLFIVNIITFQNIYSIFPMIALTIVILSFLSNNENLIRKVGVISAICWLVYAIVYKSYISIIFEAITFVNVCFALYKNIKKKRKRRKK